MSQGRPLRAVFTELLGDDVARQAYAADPTGALDEAGHGDLPGDLVAEAIVSFADTAPPDVAEHLAPFVTAHSAVSGADDEPPAASAGLDLLASAPVGPSDGSDVDGLGSLRDWAESGGAEAQPDTASLADDLDFGGGAKDAPVQADITPSTSDAVPLPDGETVDAPVEPFPAADVLPGGPAPEPDEAETRDEDVPE